MGKVLTGIGLAIASAATLHVYSTVFQRVSGLWYYLYPMACGGLQAGFHLTLCLIH